MSRSTKLIHASVLIPINVTRRQTWLFTVFRRYATLPWMYLMSRIFSSPDVAFISYVSLNFIFGLCTMLMTTMPRLLAIVSKAQVSGLRPRLSGQRGCWLVPLLLLFQLQAKESELLSTVFSPQKENPPRVDTNMVPL